MRVLMFGWEFPPHISGGLGTACHGITQALARHGIETVFMVPHIKGSGQGMDSHLRLLSASGTTMESTTARRILRTNQKVWKRNIAIRHVESRLFPYATEQSFAFQQHQIHGAQESNTIVTDYENQSQTITLHGEYGHDLIQEVYRYGQAAAAMALQEYGGKNFDVIHMHDWMTYPAGMLVKELTSKPLIAHLHSTEYDRSGEHINPEVAAIEKAGLLAADIVIAVSHLTRNIAITRYGVPKERVVVVHNAVSRRQAIQQYQPTPLCQKEKRVLFMGRVTFQKGPDYFVEAAHLVHQRMPNVRFVMAGSGDMLSRMVRRVGQLRMGSHFHFPGFMRGKDVDRMYAVSDLYVMPSVSEPFGIAPLEAILYDVPVLLSNQSGVSEVLRNALKVDFWDTREMANKICAVLSYPRLAAEMIKNCREELKTITWDRAASEVITTYNTICHAGG